MFLLIKDGLYSPLPSIHFICHKFHGTQYWSGGNILQAKSGISAQTAFDMPSLLADGCCRECLAVYLRDIQRVKQTQPTLFFPELLTQASHVLSMSQSSHGLLGCFPSLKPSWIQTLNS